MNSQILKCYKVISKNNVSFKTVENIIKYRSNNSTFNVDCVSRQGIDIKYIDFNVQTNIICYNLYKEEHNFLTSYCKDILKILN